MGQQVNVRCENMKVKVKVKVRVKVKRKSRKDTQMKWNEMK